MLGAHLVIRDEDGSFGEVEARDLAARIAGEHAVELFVGEGARTLALKGDVHLGRREPLAHDHCTRDQYIARHQRDRERY